MHNPPIARCRMKKFMKNKPLFSTRCPLAANRWLLSLALLAGSWAGAQNFVRNPDFEQPIGPDNWNIVYVGASSASDFYIHGRTTWAHRDKVFGTWEGNYFGLHFRPYTDSLMEAYASQVVSNLTPSVTYVVTAWPVLFYEAGVVKVRMWLEALGAGAPASSPYAGGWLRNDADTGAGYETNGWRGMSVTQTASPAGTIEVRLHYNKFASTANQKWLSALDGFFDHVSVMPLVPTLLPPPTILSMAVTNETVAFKWSTIMNNTYDIEVSPDLASWSKFKTNLVATGSSLTCIGALTGDPAAPQFFRVASRDYVP